MTDIEIFNVALDKARRNAYCGAFMSSTQAYENRYKILFGIGSDKRFCFAQAFWGEEWIENPIYADGEVINDIGNVAWKFHLQQMVLKENPIEYLKEFL